MRGIFRFRPSILRQLPALLKSRSISSPFPTSSFLNRNYPALIPKREYSSVPKQPYLLRTGTIVSVDIDKGRFAFRYNDPPNYVVVMSGEEYKSALSKAEGESVPTIFYYSSQRDQHCKAMTVYVKEMAFRYPDVAVFELDADEDGIASAVLAPTVQAFRDGVKLYEVVGPQVSPFSDMCISMEAIYGLNIPLSLLNSPPSNYVLLKSENELRTALSNAEVESVPTVFYFSSAIAYPCVSLALALKELAHRLPQVVVYEVNVHKEGLASAMMKLNMRVPTIQFFKEGKKEGEVVGDPNLDVSSYGEVTSHYVSAVRMKMNMLYQ